MVSYIIMFIVCLLVGVACFVVLYRFLKYLRRIEEERWGQRKDIN